MINLREDCANGKQLGTKDFFLGGDKRTMKKQSLFMLGAIGITAVLLTVSVNVVSALADAYDDQYGDIADIARASRWALEEEEEYGGWAGSNYYKNEAAYNSTKSSSRTSSKSSYTPDDYDGDVWWSGTTAHWDSQRESGEKYQVQLKRGGTEVAMVKTTGTSYNFSSYIKNSGNYYFRVRLVKDSKHGGWGEDSDTKYFEGKSSSSSSKSSSSSSSSSSLSPAAPVTAGWLKDGKGWWYRYPDGNYPKNKWDMIGGKWYFFNGEGYMCTGWINWNGAYYYCGSDGAMLVNTYTPDGFYVDANGVWVH